MTDFSKKVTRWTVEPLRVLYASKSRQVAVTLKVIGGESFIEFREKGTRKKWLLSVEGGFRQAVRNEALRELLVKANKKRAAKQARKWQ
jgi:hypothetical protein